MRLTSLIGAAALLLAAAVLTTILSPGPGRAQPPAAAGIGVTRTWTCHGTIALQGSNKSYALPSWQMSGKVPGPGADREKRCREHIEANWLNNGKIWTVLGLNAAEKNQICQGGPRSFRTDYGFDERKKDWNLTSAVAKPSCSCTATCPAGYNKDEHNRCSRKLCPTVLPNANYLVDNVGFFAWGGFVWEMVKPNSTTCTF